MPVCRRTGLRKSISHIPLGLFFVQRIMCIHAWVSMCTCVFVCVCGFVWFFLRQLSRQRELMVFSQCVYQFSLFLKQKHSLCHNHMSLNIIFYYRIPQYHQWTQLCCQFSSVAQSCPTLRPHGLRHSRPPCPSPTPGAYSNSSLSSHDATQPSHPLSSPSPPAFSLSQHQGLFKWVSSSHQVAEVLELQLQHQSFQWLFRTDLL